MVIPANMFSYKPINILLVFSGDTDSHNLLLSKVNALFSWILTEHDRTTFTFNFPNILKAAPWRRHRDSESLRPKCSLIYHCIPGANILQFCGRRRLFIRC